MIVVRIFLIIVTIVIMVINMLAEANTTEEMIGKIKINILFLIYLLYLVFS